MSDSTDNENISRYASMQKREYSRLANKDPNYDVVGNYDFHETFPYETLLLFKYGDIRRPIFNEFASLKAFDMCCGEGRMVRRMRNLFSQVDGADLSGDMIDHARSRTPGSRFYLTDGFSAGDAESNFYDFCYCTISLQHICVFETRDLIIKDLCRILKDTGKMTLQFLYSRDYPYVRAEEYQPYVKLTGAEDLYCKVLREDTHHAKWFENKYDAISTNSGCDVVIGPQELQSIVDYFSTYFESVEMWFHTISIGRTPRVLPETHPNSHIHDNYWGTDFVFIHLDQKKR